MRVALVHDWLVAQRGGENVLLEMARLFPEAPIYTLVHAPGSVHPELEAHEIQTSFIQRLPGAPRSFRQYLPLLPRAIEALDLAGYDLVLSTSHCVAKGVQTARSQKHIAYIHTPMRYVWDELPQYVPRLPGRLAWTWLARLASEPLRRWDVRSAQRPDHLIANSAHIAARIERVWGRTAEVLHPPVEVGFFSQARHQARCGYLVVSALVPYKRVDLAVRAATEAGLQLDVIGDGPERARLERLAGPSVRFLGLQQPEALRQAYGRARALLFCGVEDFGIVPVEAMAAGCPVVALRAGGVLESLREGVSGLFFDSPTTGALLQAISGLEQGRSEGRFVSDEIQRTVTPFARQRFVELFGAIVERIAPP